MQKNSFWALSIILYIFLGMSKFLEFNTRVLGTDTWKTPQHSEEIYDSLFVDYLLKDKINTKFAFQPNIWQIYDQIDTIFFSEIFWRFEKRLIPNCAFQPNIWQIYDYSAIFNWEWKFNLFKETFIAQLVIQHTYKEVTVTIICTINNQRQIPLKCKLLIRKQHNHCTNTAINTSNQLYGVHCGAL
jgi:hypothetical protein